MKAFNHEDTKARRRWTVSVFVLLVAAFFCQSQVGNRKSKMPLPQFSPSGVPGKETAELVKMFKAASKHVRSVVLNPTGTSGGMEFKRGRAAQLSDQIDQTLLALKQRVRPWAAGAAKDAVGAGRKTANRQAKDAGVSLEQIQGKFNLIDVGTVNVFARQIVMDLDKAADSIGNRGKRLLRETAQEGLDENKINRILAGGVIEGTPVATIRKLKAELEKVHGDTVAIIDKNGDTINFDVGYYAEMVARTQTRMATVTARHERLAELEIDLVAIIGRVSQNFCTAFLGQVFSLSGKSDKYPAYDSLPGGGPPFHPNCTKSTRPFVEELASDKQLDHAEILDDSEQLLGMNASQAQRSFKDLQIHAQIKDRYAKGVAA